MLRFLLSAFAARRSAAVGVLLVIGGLGFGGCAQSPQQVAASHGREYFPESTYGRASRRVIADGQPVPHGGGQYLVGKPYTIAGRTYYPTESKRTQVGMASWYGDAFHGRLTANGEIYDRDGFTAASPTMPLPSYVRVTNLRNNYSMVVRVNDRGPYASNRIMDVSRKVAEALDFKRYGTTTLKVEYVGKASLDGTDDAKLLATLRTNGPGQRPPATMFAETAPRARVASYGDFAPAPREPAEPEARPLPRRTVAYAPARAPIETEEPRPTPRRYAGYAAPRDTPEPPRAMPRRYGDYARPREPELSDRRLPPRRTSVAGVEPQPVPRARPLPPSRPMDLGTIPGAETPIRGAHRETTRVRLARARDD